MPQLDFGLLLPTSSSSSSYTLLLSKYGSYFIFGNFLADVLSNEIYAFASLVLLIAVWGLLLPVFYSVSILVLEGVVEMLSDYCCCISLCIGDFFICPNKLFTSLKKSSDSPPFLLPLPCDAFNSLVLLSLLYFWLLINSASKARLDLVYLSLSSFLRYISSEYAHFLNLA